VEARFGLAPPLAGIDVLKFQKLVLPGGRLSLRLSRDAAAPTVSFAYESAEGSHASGRLRYVAEARA
jgi:acyl dehydratase